MAAFTAHWLIKKYKEFLFSLFRSVPFIGNESSNVVVCLTTYPARLDDVWLTIESLFLQTYTPWKIILVLARDEFNDVEFPRELSEQVNRGLEIVWVDENTKSYKKLLPVVERFPESCIVTFDDDVIYERKRLQRIIEGSQKNPGCIIGGRGKSVTYIGQNFMPYSEWPLANASSCPFGTLLTGVGGILYPASSLREDILFDISAAQRVAPTADDLWFWLAAIKAGTPIHCLGINRNFPIIFRADTNTLTMVNCVGGGNDLQLKNINEKYSVIDELDALSKHCYC
jgi:hypothetical protein